MHAFLVTGATADKRREEVRKKLVKWGISLFDQVRLETDAPAVGIEQIRQFQRRLTFKPYHGKRSVGIVGEAHKLTTEAQNALLKTLEEPPGRAYIILETANAQTLLPTIISRCQHHDLGEVSEYTDRELSQMLTTMTKLHQASAGKKLLFIDEIATTRDTALAWVQQAIVAALHLLRYRVLKPKSSGRSGLTDLGAVQVGQESVLLRRLLAAHRQLSANVNPKLVLDNLFLSLER